MSRDECVKFLRDKGSEFVGLDHLAEALFCFRKSLTLRYFSTIRVKMEAYMSKRVK